MPSGRTLTDKQEKFVNELLKDKSQREAYKIAYPKCKASDKVIDEMACRLFKNVKVKSRYNSLHDRLIEKAVKSSIMSAQEVLMELSKVARANGSNFAKITTKPVLKTVLNTSTGQWGETLVDDQVVELFDTDTIPEDKKAAISCIKQTRHGITVESHDKVKALIALGEHHKLFGDKNTIAIVPVVITGEDSLEE